MKFGMVVVNLIPHNSTEGIVKAMLEEVVIADTSLLFGKKARSPEGNVDVEPPSPMDDSSMIMIEIGVDVDEGPRPNMMIGGRAQSLAKPRWPVEPAKKDADIDHKARLRCVDHAGDDPNSHHPVATASRLSMKAPMSVQYTAYLVVGVLR